jgi:hypothetical protein
VDEIGVANRSEIDEGDAVGKGAKSTARRAVARRRDTGERTTYSTNCPGRQPVERLRHHAALFIPEGRLRRHRVADRIPEMGEPGLDTGSVVKARERLVAAPPLAL